MSVILQAPIMSARVTGRKLSEEDGAVNPFIGVILAGAIGIVCVGFIVWYQRRDTH